MNLLFVPPLQQRQIRYRSELGFRLTWFVALAFLASQAFIVPVWSYYAMTRAEVRLRSIKASELVRAASSGLVDHAPLLSRSGTVQSLDGVLRGRQPVTPLLAAVERTIPDGVGLSSASLNLIPAGANRTVLQHELSLEGIVRGPDATAVIVQWREQLVRTLPARVLAARGGHLSDGGDRFQLRFTLEPLAP